MTMFRRMVVGIGNLLILVLGALLLTGNEFRDQQALAFEFSSIELTMVMLLLAAGVWRLMSGEAYERFGLAGRIWRRLNFSIARSLNRDSNRWFWVLIGTFGLYFVIHSLRHLALRNHGFDVSFLHQALFHPWGSPPLRADIARSGTALGEHLAFSLYLLAPLTWLIPSNFFVYFLQAVMVGSGVFVLIRFGPLRHQSREIWFFALVAILGHKALRGSVIWDFREDVIAFLGFSVFTAGVFSKRCIPLFVGLVLALLSKENMFLIGMAGALPILSVWSSSGEKRSGVVIASSVFVLSIAYGIFAFRIGIPAFSGADAPSPFLIRFGQGGVAQGGVGRLFLSPAILWTMLREAFSPGSLRYAVSLLLPLAPFWRIREMRPWLLPVAVGVGMNVAHSYHLQRAMIFHYELLLFPFLFAALLIGFRAAVTAGSYGRIALSLVLVACVFGASPIRQLRENFPSPQDWRVSRALAGFEADGPVAVSSRLSAQVNHLPELRVFHDTPEVSSTPAALELWVGQRFSGIPEYWILDQGDPGERVLRNWLIGAGGILIWGEPGRSRVVILRLMPLGRAEADKG